jgi:hypothetical protein
LAEAGKIPASLEERVAALEEQLAHPVMLATAPEISDEEAAKFEADLRQALGNAAFGQHRMRVLPPAPALTPETAGALLRECVAVVKPGETLVIRIPDTWGPQQVYDTQRRLSEIIAGRELGFTVLLVPGEEFAVARSGIHESGNSA